MRHLYSLAAAVIGFLTLFPSMAMAQAGLVITNLQLQNQTRATVTQWYLTYTADLVNNGLVPVTVSATVTSAAPTVQVVAGQGELHFPPAPAGGQVTSVNTFTILVDRSVPFYNTDLQWSFLNPFANAGPNQTAAVGSTVNLSGSASTNPGGIGTLTYNWAFTSVPAGSHAALSSSTGVTTSFTVDVFPGTYVVRLTVSNGTGSDSTIVTITTVNTPPVANAGSNQTVPVGSLVTLNGSASSDVDGDPLTYLWGLISVPPGSQAALARAGTVVATFTADLPGLYIAQLVVNDGYANSVPATVTVTTGITPPVANAGPNQNVNVGALVQLNGSGSTDVNGHLLTFNWTFNSKPAGSAAVLSNSLAVNPTFTADLPGIYVIQLVVNDGSLPSAPATVTVTTNALQQPTANAGQNQTVVPGAVVTLSGSGTDPQALPLTFTWSLTTRPPGSSASLSNIYIPNPTFTADQPGTYVAQLIVGDGFLHSAPSTVTITSSVTPPVAVAGSNQNVAVNTTVILDGSGSFDANHFPLTYSWSFTSLPLGSTTVLQGAATKSPSFFADVAGTYVVQLIVNNGFLSSAPSTVMITASAMQITLSPNPLNLSLSPGILTITLGAPAGAGGVTVTLSGFNPTVISVPSTALVPQNTTGTNVAVTPLAAGTTSIVASAGSGFKAGSTTVIVTTPAITIGFNSTGVGLTHSIPGTLTLTVPAPVDTAIGLTSSPVGEVTFTPASVTIPAGSTTGTFSATGGILGTANITAASSGYISGTASLLVVNLGGILVANNVTVAPGQTVPLSVTLSSPAPVDGTTVNLVSGDTSILTVSSSVYIAPGAKTPATPAQVTGNKLGSTTVTASAGGYTGDSETVTVALTLSFSPQVVTVGADGDQSVTLLLSATAPAGGLPFTLTSNNTGVATVLPASGTISAGSSSATASVHGVAGGSTSITASTTAPNVASGALPVTVTVSGSIILPTNAAVGLGQSVAFPITLSAPAPTNGLTVTLATSDSTTIDIQPRSVTIAAGQTQPATQPQVTGNNIGQATITASAPGYGYTSQTVQGNATLSFSPSTYTLTGPNTENLTLTLSAPAPSAISVAISASPTGVVTAPATVTIAQGATTATVAVVGVSPGTTTITANAGSPNITNATASITVQSAGSIGLPSGVSLNLGQSVAFQVTLPVAAPASGVTVSLSSDSLNVGVSPATVTIAAGQTQPAVAPQVTGQNLGTANITASAPAYTSTSKSVQVTGSISFSPSSLTIAGTATQNLTLTLSGPAPVGGMNFTVSSTNTSAATVGSSTATIAAGATTTTVAVTGVAPGSAVIHAKNPNLTDATANVTVGIQVDINVPASVSVTPGNSVAFPVSLVNAASGTVFLNLTTGDPTIATVTPSQIGILAGHTTSNTAVTVNGVGSGTTTVTVSATGLNSATSPVTVGFTVSITPSTLTIVGAGNAGTLTATLSGPAPSPGGITFSLTSGNTAIATITSSLTIGAGGTSVGVRVNAVALGTTTITFSASGIPSASATVVVTGPLGITTTALPNGVASTAYSAPVAASGGTAPYAWTATGLPPGLGIDPLAGTISGTPTQAGPYTPSVTVTDSSSPTPQTATKQFSVTIVPLLSIATSSLPNGVAGAVYNGTVTATGGATPLTWSATGLPAGLTIAPGTGVVSGTPTTAGTTTATVTVTDNSTPTHQTASKQFPVTIAPTLAITNNPLPAGTVNVAYSGQLAATGGTPPVTWTSTALPAGLTLNASTGAITGTPGAVGTTSFTVTATDSTGPPHLTASQQFSITIGNGLTITTTALPSGVVGSAYSAPVAASNGTAPLAWSATGLPSPLTINATSGVITGTPGASGTFPVTVTVTDATTPTNQTASKQFSLVIGPALAITTTSLPNGIVGMAYSAPVVATGGTTPFTFAATGLPSPLAINATSGVITGAPGSSGTFPVTITVTDATSPTNQTASKQLSLVIAPALAITTTALPEGVVNAAYSAPVAASNGTAPLAWSATGLPSPLTINATSGVITGTPASSGTFPVTVTVTDATTPTNQTASKQFSLVIVSGLAFTTTALPNGAVGLAYNTTVVATGGTTPFTWSATGLPSPLTINTTSGAITGTPGASGTFQVTVTVTDATTPTNLTASKQFSLTIAPVLAIATTALPNGVVGLAYSAPVAASGGNTPLAWSATGLPSPLAINATSGVITGTPGASGTFPVTITVTDATSPTNQTASKQLSLVIAPALAITTTALPEGVVNAAYSAPVAASNGTAPLAWSATGLPSPLTINATSGVITGTPGATGTFPVTVTVTDATTPTNQTASKQFSLVIVSGLAFTTTALPNGAVGLAYNTTVVATGGTTPFTWSATGLPSPLAINTTSGAITGTPGSSGTFQVTVTVTDSTTPTNQTASKQFSLTIAPVLAIATPSLPSGVVGLAYSAPMGASGGNTPLAWSATGLPSPLAINATSGVITGTPGASGTFPVTITVTDATSPTNQTASKQLSLVINPTLAITTTALPTGVSGTSYSTQLSATGGSLVYSWTAAPLPAGLTVNSYTGVISGTPTAVGTTNVVITVTDTSSPTPLQASTTLPLLVSFTAGGGTIAVSSVSVGQNLEVPITITFTPALPTSESVTISSSDSTQILLGNSGTVGSGSFTLNLGPASSIETYVQAVGTPGSVVTITVTAGGYANGVGTVTIANSGFVLSGPNGIGGAFNTYLGVTTPLTIYAAKLDSSNLFVESEEVRAGYSYNVPLTSSATSVGNVSASTVVVSGGASSAAVNFVASTTTTGTSTVSVVYPLAQSTQPAVGASISVTVQPSGLIPFSATIGNNLQADVTVSRVGNTSTSAQLTITSLDPEHLLFSTTPTGNALGTPASASITVTFGAGHAVSPDFYAHAYGSTGTVSYTISANTYGSVTSNVTLAPSGLVIQVPGGGDTSFTMPLGPTPATLLIETASLDLSGNPVLLQAVAYGVSISAAVAAPANSPVGAVTASPVAINTGAYSASTTFLAAAVGTTSITASAGGYASWTVSVTVRNSSFILFSDGSASIGQFLETTGVIGLNPTPAVGLQVTLQSNSSLLRLATSSNGIDCSSPGPWSAQIVLTVVAGPQVPLYCIESLGSSGTPTYTVSAPGYNTTTDTALTLVPSAIVFYPTSNTQVSLAGGSQQFVLASVQLDSSGNVDSGSLQSLATPETVTFSNTNQSAGTFATVNFPAGASVTNATFTPKATGSNTIAIVQPGGFTAPTGGLASSSIAITVVP